VQYAPLALLRDCVDVAQAAFERISSGALAKQGAAGEMQRSRLQRNCRQASRDTKG